MMSSLRLLAAERRGLVVTLIAALAINVAVALLIVRPLAGSSRGAGTRAKAAAEAVATAATEQRAAQESLEVRERSNEELGTFYTSVLPDSLSAARQLTYTRLPALAASTGVEYQRRRFDVSPVAANSPLTQLTIQMELQGEYQRLRQFIHQVERAPEFVIIDAVALTESDLEEPITLGITLSTYFRTVANGF